MRTRTQASLVVAALLATGAAPVRGQNAGIDPRWLAYIGCWQPTATAKSSLCVVPAAGTSAVDLVTIVKGQVTAREHIAATGERSDSAPAECAWHGAEWSTNGQRLFLRSEDTCAAATPRDGTGLITMSGDGTWLYIQGVTLGGQTGVRVQQYREAPEDILLPDDIAAALRQGGGVSATIEARAAASAPLAIADVVEASHKVDTAVLEAWLVERAEPFRLDAKRLIALADAGVPSRVIDLMVALSYPRVFAISPASRQGERLAATRTSGLGPTPVNYITEYEPLCYGFDIMYPSSAYDCGRGYGYGYGWYPGGYPVVIIYNGSSGGGGGGGSSSRPHGRVIDGQGYAKGGDGISGQALPRMPEMGSQTSSGASSSTPTSTSSSSGSTEQRTAKPRP